MKKKAILVLDCGATNVKACLVDTLGQIISSHSIPNETVADPYLKGGLIWDLNDIWNKLSASGRKVCRERKDIEIIAVTVTTFGVDGAAMMPSLIIHRLTGEFVTDTTMAGTSMLTQNKKRAFSEEILQANR